MAADQTNYLTSPKLDGFNKYAAGPKTYGLGNNSAAQSGPMGPQGAAGYMERDAMAEARKRAVMRRLKMTQGGAPSMMGGPQ